jgi:hypothetical protein
MKADLSRVAKMDKKKLNMNFLMQVSSTVNLYQRIVEEWTEVVPVP